MKSLCYLLLVSLFWVSPVFGQDRIREFLTTLNNSCLDVDIPKGVYQEKSGHSKVFLQELSDEILVYKAVFVHAGKPDLVVQEKFCTIDSRGTRPGFVFFHADTNLRLSSSFYFQVDDLSTVRVIRIWENVITSNKLYYLVEE